VKASNLQVHHLLAIYYLGALILFVESRFGPISFLYFYPYYAGVGAVLALLFGLFYWAEALGAAPEYWWRSYGIAAALMGVVATKAGDEFSSNVAMALGIGCLMVGTTILWLTEMPPEPPPKQRNKTDP